MAATVALDLRQSADSHVDGAASEQGACHRLLIVRARRGHFADPLNLLILLCAQEVWRGTVGVIGRRCSERLPQRDYRLVEVSCRKERKRLRCVFGGDNWNAQQVIWNCVEHQEWKGRRQPGCERLLAVGICQLRARPLAVGRARSGARRNVVGLDEVAPIGRRPRGSKAASRILGQPPWNRGSVPALVGRPRHWDARRWPHRIRVVRLRGGRVTWYATPRSTWHSELLGRPLRCRYPIQPGHWPCDLWRRESPPLARPAAARSPAQAELQHTPKVSTCADAVDAHTVIVTARLATQIFTGISGSAADSTTGHCKQQCALPYLRQPYSLLFNIHAELY